jgi:hypothetical protein
MNGQDDILFRFRAALPRVRQWIDEYINRHEMQARTVDSLGFKFLPQWFPEDLLQRTKYVEVEQVSFPPVDRFNLPEFSPLLQMPFAGITFRDTFYLQRGLSTESLCFHELVHVVQWARLGVDPFLFSYGIGLMQYGYEQSPFEQMAYSLQRQFEEGTLSEQVVPQVEAHADAIWTNIESIFKQVRQ